VPISGFDAIEIEPAKTIAGIMDSALLINMMNPVRWLFIDGAVQHHYNQPED